MRNGSIIHGESTFKSRLTSLNEGKPYMYVMYVLFCSFNILQLSSRKKLVFNGTLFFFYLLCLVFDKTNENSMKHTTHTLPTPSPMFLSRNRSKIWPIERTFPSVSRASTPKTNLQAILRGAYYSRPSYAFSFAATAEDSTQPNVTNATENPGKLRFSRAFGYEKS